MQFLELEEGLFINIDQINSVQIKDGGKRLEIRFINGKEETLRDDEAADFAKYLRKNGKTLKDAVKRKSAASF